MSKATEWAAANDGIRINRPRFEGKGWYAQVTDTGGCCILSQARFDEMGVDVAEALAFSRWLDDTFK